MTWAAVVNPHAVRPVPVTTGNLGSPRRPAGRRSDFGCILQTGEAIAHATALVKWHRFPCEKFRAKAAKVAKEVRLLSPRTVLPLRDTLLVFPRSHTAETVARTPAVITVVGSFNMDLFIEAPRFPAPGEAILGKN